MTPNTFVKHVGDQLGYRRDLDAKILQEANAVVRKLETDVRLSPVWFLKELVGYVVNENTVGNGVEIGANWVEGVKYRNQASPPLTETDYDTASRLVGTGRPTVYYKYGTKLYVAPTPDREYALVLERTVEDDAILQNGEETRWLRYAPYLVAAETGLIVAESLHNDIARAFFLERLNDERSALVHQNSDREAVLDALGG